MNLIQALFRGLSWLLSKFFHTSRKIKLIAIITLLVLTWFSWSKFIKSNSSTVKYETTTAQKGTLISSITASGTISSGSKTSITTKVSGVVKDVYVTNGDRVTKGQKIAQVSLDDYAQERQTAAWNSYLQAQESVKQAIADQTANDIQMWKDREAVLAAQEALNDKNENNTNPTTHAAYTDGEKMIIDKTLDQTRKQFSVSESKYLNAPAVIADAKAKVAAALRDYQTNSATIVAPESGVISDLALAPGVLVSASSSTNTSNGSTIVSAQTIAKVSGSASQLTANVNLTEIDVIKVKADQSVTLTLDAFSDLTFTGKVLSVNTTGSVSSGVTSYPVTILIDPVTVDIYPNMSVNAQIITSINSDIILVPSSAVTASGDLSIVQILKNNKPVDVQVEVGSSNDTQTHIISGVSEGDVVITSTIKSTSSTTNTTTSPFSGFGSSTTRRAIGPGGF